MENAIPELEEIRRQLMSQARPKKPKMLVVDDEPDNLDLLYRTFRREFQVLKAESGVRALELLQKEGEVAVIISDQRMPEMKGTEFLKKTLPQFPNTVRIILTGFTDIEDLVEAINSGQVYKYITKPWDPNELKAVVERAAETYDVQMQRIEELRRAQVQTNLLAAIAEAAQTADSLPATLKPIATAFAKSFNSDVCVLQIVEADTLSATAGIQSNIDNPPNWLSGDSLVKEAIKSQKIQGSVNVPADAELAGVTHYQESGIQAHLVVPITYRNTTVAVLSLQWKQPSTLKQDELSLIHLSAKHVGLALASTRLG
ncbi:response regulator [Ancylothrix sp. C2]|uniref:response regulator n=1 Tax=Ancylothrix sp. D3o TaxID=2953691 RepID=UPI0021BAA298|nr:response regulator [Ancylothrix sp. D3o]MCT7951776.1 response regulator [Ancylothrix sp. D3o]